MKSHFTSIVTSVLATLTVTGVALLMSSSNPEVMSAPASAVALGDKIEVDTFADEFTNNASCSLREALHVVRSQASALGCDYGNALPGARTIVLSAGTYSLTRAAGITGGDLNLSGTLTLAGAGITQTIIKQTIGGERVVMVESGRATLRNLTLTNGQGASTGGGLRNDANAILESVRVFSNTAANGGGVFNTLSMTIKSSVIESNRANSDGGGLRNDGTLEMTGSSVFSNTAAISHGGIRTGLFSRIVNSSILSNTATNGRAGGIGGSFFNLRNVTVANNRSDDGGAGIDSDTSTSENVLIENSIIAHNRRHNGALTDCAGGSAQAEYSFVGTGGCGIITTLENKIGTLAVPITPNFGALQLLSGTLPFLPLTASSPAINEGNILGCPDIAGELLTVDQLGLLRTGRCDMGAIEFAGAPPATPTPTPSPPPAAQTVFTLTVNTFIDDPSNDALCTLREAIASVNFSGARGGCAFSPAQKHVIPLLAGTYALSVSNTENELTPFSGSIEVIGAGSDVTHIVQRDFNSRVISQGDSQLTLARLSIESGVFVDGSAGAGINTGQNSQLTMTQVLMKGNSTNGNGGALFNRGRAMLIDVVFESNNGGALGGAIHNSGSLILENGALLRNSAGSGSALYNTNTAEFINVSVLTNTGAGPAIDNVGTAKLTLSNVTIARNTAGGGAGGLAVDAAGTVTIANSILADNALLNGTQIDCTDDNPNGGIDVMSFSIIGSTFGGRCQPEHIFYSVRPLTVGQIATTFGTLVTGTKPHLPLRAGSAAIDTGDPNGCRTGAQTSLARDQLNNARAHVTRCDMGAIEFGAPALPDPYQTARRKVFMPVTLR